MLRPALRSISVGHETLSLGVQGPGREFGLSFSARVKLIMHRGNAFSTSCAPRFPQTPTKVYCVVTPEPTVPLFTNTKMTVISTVMIKMAVRFAWQTQGYPQFHHVHVCGPVVGASSRLDVFAPETGTAQERRSEDVQPQFFFVVLYLLVYFNILLKCETGTSEVGSVNEYRKHTDKSFFFSLSLSLAFKLTHFLASRVGASLV